MYNRKGQISVIRIGIIAGIVGILLIGAAAVTYLTDQASKATPLEIAPYPNSTLWGTSEERTTSRNEFYRSTDSPEVVTAYYQQKLEEHYGNRDQSCVRLPATGENTGSASDPNIVPYQYICLFDNSGFRTTQYTRVVIYPGQPNPDPFYDAAGMTVIKYEQQWQG